MNLDVKTLFLLTIYVEAILGLLLLFAWMQSPAIKALGWWGGAHLMRALSVALYGTYGSAPEVLSIDLANALLFTSYAITWMGARIFDGRSARPGMLVAGAAVWIVASRLPGFGDSADVRALLSAGIICVYTWLAAYEFWSARGERLVSRWPAIFMLFAHGALYLLRTPLSMLVPWSISTDNGALATAWLTVLSAEALLFTIAVAFIMLAMAKERTELEHKTAALVDPLTGIANRRGFMARVERAVAPRGARDSRHADSMAVMLIDLDHFKSINDRFGHAVGDEVLRIFAETASENMRPTDLVGRLGGEEFGAVLYGAGREAALKVAERLRAAFADAAVVASGQRVTATVSIGIAISPTLQNDISTLLAAADHALYRAKERGRNRVELAIPEMMQETAGTEPAVVTTAATNAAG